MCLSVLVTHVASLNISGRVLSRKVGSTHTSGMWPVPDMKPHRRKRTSLKTTFHHKHHTKTHLNKSILGKHCDPFVVTKLHSLIRNAASATGTGIHTVSYKALMLAGAIVEFQCMLLTSSHEDRFRRHLWVAIAKFFACS